MAVLQRQHWDVRPSQYGIGAPRGMALAGPEPPYNLFGAAENMLDYAGIGVGDNPNYDQAARGFLIVDRANPHRRDAYAIPIANFYPDGVVRVHPDAIEPAERALRLHPAGDYVRAEALCVLDHYSRRFTQGEKPVTERGAPDSKGVPSTNLARRGHAEARKLRFYREEKRRAAARRKKLTLIGEQGRRREAVERIEVFRNEHDMLLPIPLNR